MLRPILKLGDSVLHTPARPVAQLTYEIDQLIGDMIETMYAAPGIGLAAPQVGVPLRIFVVDLSVGRSANDLIVMITPSSLSARACSSKRKGASAFPGSMPRSYGPSGPS